MDTTRRTAAWREVGVVIALSTAGVALASAIAFAPWYAGSGPDRNGSPAAVEVPAANPVRPVLVRVDVGSAAVRPR